MAPRDHFRVHGRLPVRIDAVLRQQDNRALAVTIHNMGFGGAGVELVDQSSPTSAQEPASRVELLRDAHVALEIVTPALWDPLVLPGTIVWNSEPSSNRARRAGIRFEPLGATTLLSLFDVLGAN